MVISMARFSLQPLAAVDIKNADGEENQNREHKDCVLHQFSLIVT
jgi:hypothetical protein